MKTNPALNDVGIAGVSPYRSRGYESKTQLTRFEFYVFSIGLALVVAGGLFTFPRLASALFFSWDSATFVANAKEYLEDGTWAGLIASYTQSFGNLAYPLNFNLLPEVWFARTGGQINPVSMYVIASSLFYASAYALASMMGFGPLTALVSGLSTVALTMPFTSPPIYSIVYWWFSPYAISLVYQYAILLITVYCIGRFRTLGNLIAILLLLIEALWAIVAGAKAGIIMLFSVGLLAVAIATSSETRAVFAWRSFGAIVLLAVFAFTGPLDFIGGVYAYTATTVLFTTIPASGTAALEAFLQAIFPSLTVSWLVPSAKDWLANQLGYVLTVLSALGVIWTIIRPPTRTARHLAIAMIAISPFLVLFLYGNVLCNEMYPLFVIFAVVGTRNLCGALYHAALPRVHRIQLSAYTSVDIPRRWYALATVAILTVSLIFVARHRQVPFPGWTYPPSRPPLIEKLASDIGFRAGDAFRGRYVDMSITAPLEKGVYPPGTTLVYGLIQNAIDHSIEFGNDLTIQGPRFYDVPVAMEVNRLNTPVSVLFHTFLLAEKGQTERSDMRTITHFDPRLFRLLGIRYVLSHRPLDPSYASKVEIPGVPAGTSLYEIPKPNTGQYSPTRIIVKAEWQSALENIASPEFDPEQSVIVHENWVGESPLVQANARIVRTRKGYRVLAESAGSSLIILPFEFSRCLTVQIFDGDPVIGRADFFLTGVRFDRKLDAEFQLRFGPYENPRCRLSDLSDMRAMNLDASTFEEFQKKHPGRFAFEGIF